MSISSQMEHVLRTLRTVSVQCDLSASDADLVAEPDVLLCPITRTMFRDPVVVVDSGHTYERSAIESHFQCNGAKDPLTGLSLSSTRVVINWMARQIVQAWLDKHPDVTPDGWDSRELLEPSKDDGTRTFDDEGDIGVLRTWRAMCPELQERWPELDMENIVEVGRKVLYFAERTSLLPVAEVISKEDGRVEMKLTPRVEADERAGCDTRAQSGGREADAGGRSRVWTQLGARETLEISGGRQLTSESTCVRAVGQLTSLEGVEPQRQSADACRRRSGSSRRWRCCTSTGIS